MVNYNLLDIIKSNPITHTIWRQDLEGTMELRAQMVLFRAYTNIIRETFDNQDEECFNTLYRQVLQKFEESYI